MDYLSVLPACAGVIPVVTVLTVVAVGFTRMRGGDPKSMLALKSTCKFYPHARG